MYSTTLRQTIAVPRRADECFSYLRDFSTIEQWDPGVYRARKLTSGPVQIGTEFALILSSFGRRVPMTYRLVEEEPNRRLRLLGTGDGIEADDNIVLTPLTGAVTRIDYEARLVLNGVSALTGRLIQPLLERIGQQAVFGLQAVLADEPMPFRVPPDSLSFAHRLILPAAWQFTERGYLNMPCKGLTRPLSGKTVVVTGATSGIGLAAACELGRRGARLWLVGRGLQRLEQAAGSVRDFAGADVEISLIEADLTERSAAGEVAAQIRRASSSIDVLVNNAGALYSTRQVNAAGEELSLAINLLSPFRLTKALLPSLAECRGRVINVASGGQYLQALDLDDLNYERQPFDGVKAYACAKRALVSVTQTWARRSPGVDFHVMHPGWASTPGVSKSLPGFERVMKRYLRDARMGADTIVWLAGARPEEAPSGYFWFDRRAQPVDILSSTRISRADADRLFDGLDQRG